MAFAEIHDATAAALCLLHKKEKYGYKDEDRHNRRQRIHPPGRLFRRFSHDIDFRVFKRRHQRRISRRIGGKGRTVFQLAGDSVVCRNLNGIDLLLLHLSHKIRICNFRLIRSTADNGINDTCRHNNKK